MRPPVSSRRPARRRSWRLCLALAAAVVGTAGLGAAEPRIPPISGRLEGDFQPLQLAGAPALHWTLELASRSENERAGVLVADAPGTHLRVELNVDAAGEGTWRVVEGRIELKPWLNGLVAAGVATVSGGGRLDGGKFSGDVQVRLAEVDLGELIHFADADHAYVRSAEGRVEGTVTVRLRAGVVSAGEGELRLPAGTLGTVFFAPSPGLLTSYLPAQVQKVYPGIAAIEMGVTPLEAKVLRLAFHPDGDRQGRSARLRIEGRPRDPKLIAPLELDVNFIAPLESLARKMFDSRLRIGGAK